MIDSWSFWFKLFSGILGESIGSQVLVESLQLSLCGKGHPLAILMLAEIDVLGTVLHKDVKPDHPLVSVVGNGVKTS